MGVYLTGLRSLRHARKDLARKVYSGIPNKMFNGKVTPRDRPK
jgi:hypothetical protein